MVVLAAILHISYISHPIASKARKGARGRQGPTLTIKVSVDVVLEERPRAEVDELDDLSALSVGGDEEVLVLDVPVDDTGGVALSHHVDHLAEEVPRLGLGHSLPIRDVIEEILDGFGSLHDDHEAVGELVPRDQSDDAGDVGDPLQEADLERNSLAVYLQRRKETS